MLDTMKFQIEFECCECRKVIRKEIMFEVDETYICFECLNESEKRNYEITNKSPWLE